jgi:hypothetical protein
MSRILHTTARAALAAALLIPALAARAQNTPAEPTRLGPATGEGEPRLMGGLTAVVGQPVGTFHRYVANGYGMGGHGLARLGRSGAVALRLDGGFLNYGNETLRLPFSSTPGGGRIGLDLTTSNNIFWLGAGPQLMVPRGRVRPYGHATAGFSYFATTSSVRGRRSDSDAFAEETNYDDAQFAWGAGGGVLVPVFRNPRSLVLVDVGARYHDNGRNVRYLREGGIRDLPNGGIELDVIRSRADLVTWHVGVSIGAR